jgi:hypothetical protein
VSEGSVDITVVVRKLAAYPDVADSLERLVNTAAIRHGRMLEVSDESSVDQQAASWQQVVRQVDERRSDLVVLHHFHSPGLADFRHHLSTMKAMPHAPLVALSNGDPMYKRPLGPGLPRSFVQGSKLADVVFSTSMGRLADHLVRRASCRMALLPWGLDQLRFGAPPPPLRDRRKDFRVVFIGSRNRSRNPLRRDHWYARRRERLIKMLDRRFGAGFAVFGHGWEGLESWQGPVPFAEQQQACRRADVVVGGVPFSTARYYTSDRVFIQIASGVPFVDLRVDGAQTILREDDHWHLADSLDEVVERCDDLLSRRPSELIDSGFAAAEYVRRHHTIEQRFRSLTATLVGLRLSVSRGVPAPPPDLGFFLPEVDPRREISSATRGWQAD